MAVSSKTKNARTAARKAINEARGAVDGARNRAEDARSSGFYTEEGTRNYIGGWVKDVRGKVKRNLERIERQAKEARKAAEKTLREARTVPESKRATSAAVMAPLIAASASDPNVLIRAYERRAPNSTADRLVLEEAIGACLDGGLGGVTFAEDWERVQSRLSEEIYSEAEQTAADDLAALDRLDSYIEGARTVFAADTDAIERGGGARYTAGIEGSRHRVAKYERDLDSGAEDGVKGNVRTIAASLPTENEPLHLPPEEVPEEVQRETEERRREREEALAEIQRQIAEEEALGIGVSAGGETSGDGGEGGESGEGSSE